MAETRATSAPGLVSYGGSRRPDSYQDHVGKHSVPRANNRWVGTCSTVAFLASSFFLVGSLLGPYLLSGKFHGAARSPLDLVGPKRTNRSRTALSRTFLLSSPAATIENKKKPPPEKASERKGMEVEGK